MDHLEQARLVWTEAPHRKSRFLDWRVLPIGHRPQARHANTRKRFTIGANDCPLERVATFEDHVTGDGLVFRLGRYLDNGVKVTRIKVMGHRAQELSALI